ncbi:MAG TPA: tetratricopeptide repeat protein [Pyrinomonadaceae bacterium]|jgi:tetratricopeptide (TPR) repeat protein|nr:tetratricopeptide repeat protein [Pyrinomonadaceae bacterium]
MIWDNTKLLLGLLYRPVSSMGRIVDEGHWLYAAVVVAALSMLFHATVTSVIYNNVEAVYREVPPQPAATPDPEGYGEEEFEDVPRPHFVYDRHPLPLVGNRGWWFVSFAQPSFFTTVLGMAILYIPCLLLLVAMSGVNASFSLLLRRDYGPLLTCGLMAWAAAHLPFVLAGFALEPLGLSEKTALGLWAASATCFGLLMALGLRMLFGINYSKGLVLVAVAALSFSVQAKLFSAVSPFLFSPFLLFYAFMMFRGGIGDIGYSLRQRQSFRRSMEAATINPRDAGAHYQLGLIYQYRRQYAEAISRFEKAVQIANDETDAHFQLGRIAREQGRLQDAINYFSTVLEQDDKHSHSEVWREIGATYLAASMFDDAKDALAKFIDRRPYDPEGLYYYGKTLEQLGQRDEAREMFGRCVEAVKTMPSYRYREQRKWDKLARDRLASKTA